MTLGRRDFLRLGSLAAGSLALDGNAAALVCRMEDFFYPAPLPPGKRPILWDGLRKARDGQKIRFSF